MSPTLVVEPNVVGAKFKQVFSVLRLDQVDLLLRDGAEGPLDVYVVDGPTLAAHRELRGLQRTCCTKWLTANHGVYLCPLAAKMVIWV